MIELTAPGMRTPHISAFDALPDERWPSLPITAVLTHQIDTVPASVLPHLAERFHLAHTVAWRRAATDERRRYLIKDAVRRHRLKGTLAGLKLAAEDAGAVLTRAVVPPAKLFAAKAQTRQERNAFVAAYPQLRFYRRRTRGTAGAVSFVSKHRFHFLVRSDAVLRMAERAFLWRDGVERELAVLERELTQVAAQGTEPVRVAAKGTGGFGFVAGAARCRFPQRSTASSRIYTLSLAVPYVDRYETLRLATAGPGLEALDVRYEEVTEKGTMDCLMPGAAFAGAVSIHNGGRGFLVCSSVPDRVYRRLYLFDPEVAVSARQVSLHLNEGILTMPAHRAHLDVKITGRMDVRRWCGPYVRGHLVTRGHEALYECLESLRDAARGSDWIDVSTKFRRVAVAGVQHSAGSLTASALTERI
jgi:hypothetical protein